MKFIQIPEDEFKRLLKETIQQELTQHLPELLDEYQNKAWLTIEDLIELTSWSRRTIQHLRDTRQITFFQHGRKILFPRAGIEDFLEGNCISRREQ